MVYKNMANQMPFEQNTDIQTNSDKQVQEFCEESKATDNSTQLSKNSTTIHREVHRQFPSPSCQLVNGNGS